MRFYTETIEQDGVVVTSDGRTDEILFEELTQRRGRFWKDLGFKRLLLSSQAWQDGEYLGTKSNIRLTVTESDTYTERDQILDHVDAALLAAMDFDTLYVGLTRSFEELQHEVDENCDRCDNSSNSRCLDDCTEELSPPNA